MTKTGKKVTDHGIRIETLETQAMATPTYSDAPLPNVTVSIPDNIATTENISELVDEAIERDNQKKCKHPEQMR